MALAHHGCKAEEVEEGLFSFLRCKDVLLLEKNRFLIISDPLQIRSSCKMRLFFPPARLRPRCVRRRLKNDDSAVAAAAAEAAGGRDPLLSRPAYFNFHGLADAQRKTLTFKTFNFPPE